MKIYIISILTIFSLLFGVNKTGTTAAKFLTIGVGAKAIAMGDAYTSISDDATAMFWNPAGMGKVKQNELYINHVVWVADISFNYIGLVIPLSSSQTLGFNLTAVTMDEMDVTRYGNEDTGETFKAGDYALGIAYSRNLTDRFIVGVNTKYIRESISNCSASGFAFDIGTIFETPFGFRLGSSISNFGPKMQMVGPDLLVPVDIDETIDGNNESTIGYLSTDKFDLPLLLRVGISGDVILSNTRFTWSVDGNHPNDNSSYVNTGFELSLFKDIIQFRGGAKSLFMSNREDKYSVGLGLHYPLTSRNHFYFDYAYGLLEYLGDVQKMNLRITF